MGSWLFNGNKQQLVSHTLELGMAFHFDRKNVAGTRPSAKSTASEGMSGFLPVKLQSSCGGIFPLLLSKGVISTKLIRGRYNVILNASKKGSVNR